MEEFTVYILTKLDTNLLLESLVTAIFVAVIFSVWKSLFSPHKLIPVNIENVSISTVRPTAQIGNNPTLGLETTVPVRIQNQGGVPANKLSISYYISQQKLFNSSLGKRQRLGESLYPSQTTDLEFCEVLNLLSLIHI